MNIRKASLGWYLARTFLLAVPGGMVIGYAVNTFSANKLLVVLTSGFLAGLLGIAISTRNFRQVIAPMKEVINDLESLAAKSLSGGARSINTVGEIKQAFREILDGLTSDLGRISGKIEKTCRELVNYAELTAEEAAATASAVSQVASSSQEVSASAQTIARASEETAGHALEGSRGLLRLEEQMNAMQRASAENATAIQDLTRAAQQVSQFAEVIRQIAEQTNLLALTAAIEAARAGQQGKGFAVVAEEVRKLAEQAGSATGKIQELIELIQRETHRAVQKAGENINQIRAGLEMVREITGTVEGITSRMEALAGEVQAVTAAAEEVANSIQHIAGAQERHLESMEKAKATIREMEGLSAELLALSRRFRLDA